MHGLCCGHPWLRLETPVVCTTLGDGVSAQARRKRNLDTQVPCPLPTSRYLAARDSGWTLPTSHVLSQGKVVPHLTEKIKIKNIKTHTGRDSPPNGSPQHSQPTYLAARQPLTIGVLCCAPTSTVTRYLPPPPLPPLSEARRYLVVHHQRLERLPFVFFFFFLILPQPLLPSTASRLLLVQSSHGRDFAWPRRWWTDRCPCRPFSKLFFLS